MRKSYKFKLQNQSNTIKIGNMIDDMWHIHVHIIRLARRYYRIYGKNISASRLNKHITKLKKTTKPHWKALSRKVKGSGNYYRVRLALARLYRKISRQRLDWRPWKLATELCTVFDILIFETLNIDGMKRLWGRKVSDNAFYQLLQILKQKCAKHGNQTFHQINMWTATTKPCSDCGNHNEELTLEDRQWTCPECGSYHDRDVNAAINIKRAGLAALSGDDIRRVVPQG